MSVLRLIFIIFPKSLISSNNDDAKSLPGISSLSRASSRLPRESSLEASKISTLNIGTRHSMRNGLRWLPAVFSAMQASSSPIDGSGPAVSWLTRPGKWPSGSSHYQSTQKCHRGMTSSYETAAKYRRWPPVTILCHGEARCYQHVR